MKAIVNGKLVFPDRICEGAVLIENGKIVASGEDVKAPDGAEIIDAGGLYVGPGFIDQHLHGYSTVERIDVINDVRAVAEKHLLHGTTTLTPSAAFSATREEFYNVILGCNEAIREGNTNIIGIHFEGPYINPQFGANAHLAWEFSEKECDDIFKAAEGNVIHCTYAPEMPYAEKVEATLQKYGVIGDIGHTKADPDSFYRAVSKGAKIATHLFNAMGRHLGYPDGFYSDPQESVSDIAFSVPDMYYELISDSRAVHARLVSQRQAFKNAGEDHLILISDCTGRDAVLNPDDYPPEDRRSAKDLNFNLRGQLSGSRLTVSQAARNFKKAVGVDIRVLFKCSSTNSAKALGIDDKVGSIEVGRDANIVFVDEDFFVKEVIFQGEKLENIRP